MAASAGQRNQGDRAEENPDEHGVGQAFIVRLFAIELGRRREIWRLFVVPDVTLQELFKVKVHCVDRPLTAGDSPVA